MFYIVLILIAFAANPAFCLDQQALAALVDPVLARQAAVIEVVTVAGKLSHIEYPQSDLKSEPLPSPLPGLSLEKPELIPYGTLEKRGRNRYRRNGPGPGGLLLDLAAPGKFRDLLAYQSLALEGDFSGRWSVALADENLAKRDDNISLGAPGSSPVSSFQLGSIVDSLDLSRSRYLVFRLEGDGGALDLKRVFFSRSSQPDGTAMLRAAWLWDGRMPVNKPARLFDLLKRHRISRIYLQVNDEPEQLAPFMKEATRRGIAIWALDGSPESVNDFSPLLQRIDAVSAFNRRHPDFPFVGFQLDVEPYLLKDFSRRKGHYSARYLELLDSAGDHCRSGRILLSAALPFWFNQLPVNGRDLAWEALRRLDEAAVMGYRTSYSELLEITRSLLAVGEKLGKPVLLGLELMPVPDETHQVLKRVPAGSPGAVTLAGESWGQVRSYLVSGTRLSFDLNRGALPDMLNEKPPFSSFKGWVLHSVEGLDMYP